MDQRTRHTDDEVDADHDLTNGRWLEQEFADALDQWGYLTARNEHIFEPETDVIARRDELRGEPHGFLVVECKDWHQTPGQRDAVETIALQAALTRATPVLAVARRVTESAWQLAQLLDIRIVTESDLGKDQLPPLTKRRPLPPEWNAQRAARTAHPRQA